MDDSSSSRKQASWRGAKSRGGTEARHRWQRDPAAVTSSSARGAARIPLPLRLGALFLGTLLAIVAFIVVILSRPQQVPLIAVTAAAYPAPLPPNGWAGEDVSGLAALDGETIALYDARSTASSRSTMLEALRNRLDESGVRNARGPAIIYLNAHAAVDGNGRPCLIPPRASAVDNTTWLPVEQIFDLIAEYRGRSADGTLIIFDANRLDVEWQIGVVRNTFVERLTTLLESQDGPRSKIAALAVLTAAGTDEVSHVSSDLGGSVFGHFLRLGLAGRADETRHGGNNDSRVGLSELQAYLSESVADWCLRNRDAAQSPVLLAATNVDFPIAWVCRTPLGERTSPSRSVSTADVAALWQRVGRLASRNPVRYAPKDWSDVLRALRYLEQAAASGRDYDAVSRATAEDLAARLTAYERQATASDVDRWNVFRVDDGSPRPVVPVHSLALRRAFDRRVPAAIEAWDHENGRLSGERLALAEEIDAAEGGPVDEARFLRLLARSPASLAEPATIERVVALHRRSAAAAAPFDERAWPWIRDKIAEGDDARRMVEDAVMAGEAIDEDAFAAADSAYAAATATGTTVSDAYRLLDRVRADQVALARWLTDPRQRRAVDDRDSDLVNATLLPLITEANRLAADFQQQDASTENGLRMRTESIRGHHELLREHFDRACARLLDEPLRTAAVLRELDLVLAVPLLPSQPRNSMSPAQQRTALGQQRQEIARDLAAATEATADDAPPVDALRQMAARWQRHPLAAIFDGSRESEAVWPSSIVDPDDADRLGALVRQSLSATAVMAPHAATASPAENAAAEGAVAPASGDDGEHPLATGAREWNRLAEQLRIVAPLQGFGPTRATDPVARRTALDLAQLLVGQSERKIEDFWGPARPGEPPFFLTARDDLEAAQSLGGFHYSIASQIVELDRLCERRERAARDGVRVKVSDVLLTSPGRAATAIVAAWPGDDPTSRAIPAGTAAVVAGRPAEWTFAAPRSITVPPPAAGANVELSIVAPAGDASESAASDRVGVLYRGHLFDAPLMVSVATGPTVDYTPPELSPTTLTVRSSQQQGLSVVFVLDCSASMSASAGAEGFGASATRLDLAREALSRMLAELANRRGTRVGVVFYGHRVGWRQHAGEGDEAPPRFQKSVQREYSADLPDAVMPYNDVEIVMPLGRFDGGVAGEIESKLELVRPWGETPLYLAIDDALKQFGDGDADNERSVIVITDGLNEQSNPSAAARRSPAAVLATWQQQKAAIEIIGFGLSADDAGRAAVEFGELADATGGDYESVDRATELLDALERRIGPGSWQVRPLVRGEEMTAAIGKAVNLSERAELPSDFRVTVDGRTADVRADGGEALELIAGDTGPIVSARYLAGSPRFAPLVTGSAGTPTGLLVGLHRPLRSMDGGVTFDFSLQNEDLTFRKRPAAVWIEVTPVRDGAAVAGAPYVFVHNSFLPQTPVPVVRWTASQWPADAAAARVRYWCDDAAADPVGTLPLAELLDAGRERTLPGLDGVVFEAFTVDESEGLRVDVVERHTGDAVNVGRVGVTWSGPAPRRIVQVFDAERGVVLHTLRFDSIEAVRGPAAASLVVTTRDELDRRGARLDPPAIIDVSDQADLLVPFRSPYAAETPAPADTSETGDDAPPALLAPGA